MILYGMCVPVAVWQVRLLTAISVYFTFTLLLETLQCGSLPSYFTHLFVFLERDNYYNVDDVGTTS